MRELAYTGRAFDGAEAARHGPWSTRTTHGHEGATGMRSRRWAKEFASKSPLADSRAP